MPETVLILHCEPSCPFGKRCAEKYADGQCKDRVISAGQDVVVGEPGEVTVVGSKVTYTLADPIIKPAHKVVVEAGIARVSEV